MSFPTAVILGPCRFRARVIEAFTGDQLAIPEVRSSLDVAILSRCAVVFRHCADRKAGTSPSAAN